MSLRYISRTCLRAVQGLKDQNSKGIIKNSPARPRSESDNSTQFRCFSGAIEPMKKACVDEQRRSREAEKAEYVMQLIIWGPK